MPNSNTIAAGYNVPAAHPSSAEEAFLRWQAHVDAGRIPVLSEAEGGTRPPCPPAVAANRAATDALFRTIARDRRRLAREHHA